MTTLEIPLPDHLDEVLGFDSPASFEKEARFLLAAKLYESGRLSSGTCAEIAGCRKREFILRLHQAGVHVVNWDAEDLLSEQQTELR
jgi:predicted HTH domain antitoxin